MSILNARSLSLVLDGPEASGDTNGMNVYQVAGLVGVVLVVGGGVFLHDLLNRRRALRLLSSRPQLAPHEFGRSYFGESTKRAALAAELREILRHHVPFALDGLTPDDDLVRDLRMDALDSMAAVELLLEVEARLGIEVPDSVAENLRTLRDLVDYLEPRVASTTSGSIHEAVQQRDEADER